MLGLYLFAPEQHRRRIQATIRSQINVILIAELVLIAVAIPSTIWSRTIWLRVLAWLVFLVVTGVCLRKTLTPPPPDEEKESPL